MDGFLRKILIVFLFIVNGLFLKPLFCEAYNPEIDTYKVNVTVGKDRVYHVQEQIKVLFYSPMHIFERIIPLEGYTIQENEKGETYNIKISDIKSDREISTYKDINNNKHIKMGSEKEFVNGQQNYRLNYNYTVSVVRMNNKNEFYFPLITSGWAAPIPKFSFSIKMPKNFNQKEIYFYDKFGNSTSVNYYVKDNCINGFYKGSLYPNDTLIIKIDLPKNYFEKTLAEKLMPIMDLLSYVIPILLLIFVIFMRYFLAGNKSLNTVEVSPPNGYGPLQISYIFSQKANSSDIAVLLLTLANKGYIKIEEYKNLESNENYKLIKIKNYDGKSKYEKMFMDCLFTQSTDFVTLEDISQKSFNKVSKTITDDLRKQLKPMFDKKLFSFQNITVFLMILSWFLLCIYIGIKIGFALYNVLLFILPTTSYYLLVSGIRGLRQKRKNANIHIFAGCLLLVLTITVVADAILINNPQLIPSILVTFASIVIMNILKNQMIKFSITANNLYLRVLSFKDFIEKLQPEKLQRFINKDCNYFYKILPYAYVYGLSKNWLKKFEYINCPPPVYYNNDSFYKGVLDGIMNEIVVLIEKKCTLQ